MKRHIAAAGLALAAIVSSAHAAGTPAPYAQIAFVPANSGPTPPSGLKVTCLNDPNTLQSSKTCPVVKYLGMTSWAYSYIDNRVSFALVTYDGTGKIVRNVEKPGARYVWNMTSSGKTQSVDISGQSNQYVEVPWNQLGP